MPSLAGLPTPPPGSGPAGTPVAQPRPDRPQVLGGGGTAYSAQAGVVLARAIDDVERAFGTEVYELMRVDPQVASSFDLARRAIVSGRVQVDPAYTVADPDAGVTDADVALAARIAADCRRWLDRLDRPFRETLHQLLEAKAVGAVLAEVDYERPAAGPDAGRFVPASLRVLSRTSWHFVRDPYGRILGYVAQTADGPRFLPAWKFVLHRNKPRGDDPRGRSDLRPAYDPWNLKKQAGPAWLKFLLRFGEPFLVINVSPDAQPQYPTDADGRPDYTQPQISPEAQAAAHAARAIGGSFLVNPPNGSAELIQAQGDGSAFKLFAEYADRQIARAILGADRAQVESEHNSRADSETALGFVMQGVREDQEALARTVEDGVLWPPLVMNYGKAVADRLTPIVTFPSDAEVAVDLVRAIATLIGAGGVTPSMVPDLYRGAGLPVPAEDEIPAILSATPRDIPGDGVGAPPRRETPLSEDEEEAEVEAG